MLMNDKVKTRVRADAVTSYAADKGVNYTHNDSWPTINLTIGSVKLVLDYKDEADRNLDIQRLDDLIE